MGEGSSGDVLRGLLRGSTVAVKRMQRRKISEVIAACHFLRVFGLESLIILVHIKNNARVGIGIGYDQRGV